jgi:SAM-dependent methyltransferase
VARCLYCGATRLAPVYTGVRDHFGIAPGAYDFLGCADCASVSLHPVPSADAIANFYPPDYTFRAAATTEPLARRLLRGLEWQLFYRPQYRGRVRSIRRLTGLVTGRVLEVGCGSGTFLTMLAGAGFEPRGLDISPDDTKYARDVLGLAVTEGDLATAAADAERYDAVLLFYVVEHVPDPIALVRQAFTVLRPGGWVVIAVPVIDSAQARVFGPRWSQVTEAPRHISLPSRRGLSLLLRGAGFTDVRSTAMPLLDNAGVIVMSLLPGAATPQAYGRDAGTLAPLVRRAAAALLLPLAVIAAAADRLTGRPGMTMVCARRPGSGAKDDGVG